MEKEVFADCGAWKNFHDLEDSLTLEELTELYDIAVERQNRVARLIGGAYGLDLEESGPVSSEQGKNIPMSSEEIQSYNVIHGADDIKGLPYGLGYETV